MLEKDLYYPIKDYFTNLGYEVKGEVKNCDIVAIKDEEIIIIELKLHLNLDVILQAVERQKIASKVYIGIPALKNNDTTTRHKRIYHLLRRLEIGLLTINDDKVSETIKAIKFSRATSIGKSNKIKEKTIQEFSKRKSNDNIGGSSKEELMTAYREEAILIAQLLKKYVVMSPKQLVEYGASRGVYSILKANYYGWFAREKGGFFRLTQDGKTYLSSLDEQSRNVIYD